MLRIVVLIIIFDLISSTTSEWTGNICSKRFVLLCSEGKTIKIISAECPNNRNDNASCNSFQQLLNNASRSCDKKSQCRLVKTKTLTAICDTFENTIPLTYACLKAEAWITTPLSPAVDLTIASIRPQKLLPEKVTSHLNMSISTEYIFDKVNEDRISSKATQSPHHSQPESHTYKTDIKTTAQVTAEFMPEETTTTRTIKVIPTETPINSTSFFTMKPTTAVPIKSSLKTTSTFTFSGINSNSTSSGTGSTKNVETTRKLLSKIEISTKGFLTPGNKISTNSEKEALQTLHADKCLHANNSIKADGNYTWTDHPKCFLQCLKGRPNWECCQPTTYFYVSKCRLCLPEQFPDNCNGKHTATAKQPVTTTTIYPVVTEQKIEKARGYCEAQIMGSESNRGRYTFRKTRVLDNVVSYCKYGAIGTEKTFRRYCFYDKYKGAHWDVLDLSNCAPKNLVEIELRKLEKEKIDKEKVFNISNKLVKICTKDNHSPLKESDIKKITGLLGKIFDSYDSNEQIAANVLTVFDSLLEEKNEIASSSASTILKQINILGSTFKLSGKQSSMVVAKRDISFGVTKLNQKEIKFSISSENDMLGSFGSAGTRAQSIVVPSSATRQIKGDVHAYFYFLRDDTLFQGNTKTVLQSSIIAATITNNRIENLEEPIEIKLLRKTKEDVSCRFWNIVNSSYSTWSKEGCSKVSIVDDIVTCRCNHLTNFALLLDPQQSYTNPPELRIFSFIGCLISILGLGLTLVTFICFAKLRKKIPAKILICMCLSLLLLLIVFVAGVNQTKNATVCHIVANLLHYFTLTTFSWMLVEALNLYRTIVKVFTRGNDSRFFRWMCFYAWGIPLLTVGVTGYLTSDNFRVGYYTQYCLVKGAVFYYTLLLPVCVIMVINCVIFVPVFKNITSGEKLLKDSIQERQMVTAKRAKSIFAVIVVLGISWVFGVLAVGDLRVTFQWLFCIFSSFQGFFIFLMFVLLNEEARKVWKQTFSIFTRQKSNNSSMRMLQKANTNEPASITINGEAYGYSDDHVFIRRKDDVDGDDEEYEDDNAV